MTDAEQFPTGGLPTLAQHRARRGVAPSAGVHTPVTRFTPGDLEEIEASARRGATIDPGQVLGLVEMIGALSKRIAVRFNEMADAEAKATEYAAQVANLKATLNELSPTRRAHVCVDRCRPNQHVAFEGRALVERLETSIAELRERMDEVISDRNRFSDDMARYKERMDEVISDRNRFSGEVAELRQSLGARDRMLAEATGLISAIAAPVWSNEITAAIGAHADDGYVARLVNLVRSIRAHLSSSTLPASAWRTPAEGPTGPTSPTGRT
jgi:hypothetical protein